MIRLSLLQGPAACALLLATAAGAHPAAPPEAEIVVTATGRPRPQFDVPVAISTVTGEGLAHSGATDIRQLNQLAPFLLVSSTGSESNAVARMRGVGTIGDNPGLESAVAVFVDGVYRARTGTALNELGAVERIELLRGPQGTLFGRNSSAGLINIVTKAPEFRLGGSGEVSYGNYGAARVSARITGPLSPIMAASAEGVFARRDGFLDIVDGAGRVRGETNDRHRYMLRGQIVLRPDSAASLRIIGDYSERQESCCGAVYIDTGEETAAGPSARNRIVSLLNALAPGSVPATPAPYARHINITPGRDYGAWRTDWGLSAQADYSFDSGTTLTSITAYRTYRSSDYGDYDYSGADLIYRDPDTSRAFRTISQELRARGKAFGGRLDWLVGGYYGREQLKLRDDIVFGADYGRFGACRLLAGAGVTSNLDGSPPRYALCGVPLTAGAPNIGTLINGAVPAGPLRDGLTALAGIGAGSGDQDTRYRQRSENISVFTHNVIDLGHRVTLTAGLRYTHEVKRLSATFRNNNATCATLQGSSLPTIARNSALGPTAALAGGILTLGCLGNSSTGLNGVTLDDRMSDEDVSGTAVLSWKPTGRLMLYASYARGYKGGGYNLDRFELGNLGVGTAISPLTYFTPRNAMDAASLRFAPERADAFEIGVRYRAQRWTAALTAFHQAFTGFQLNSFNGTSFIVQNINGCGVALSASGTCADVDAGLISRGIEAEATADPLPDVHVTAGLSYTDARYADRLVGSGDGAVPLDPAFFLLPGSRNNNAPELVTTASIAWTPPIGTSGLSALFYLDARRTSGYNTGADLYPEKYQPGFTLINARVGLNGRDGRWAVELWAQNLFDVDYMQVAFSSPLQSTGPANQSSAQLGRGGAVVTNQLFSAYLGEPRTWGATLRTRF